MDINALTTLVGSLGFPIVACGAMFYEMHQQNRRHAEEMEKMSSALENNTLALTELRDYVRQSNCEY